MAKKQTKQIKFSTILLYFVLVLSIAHLTILTLSLFNILKINVLGKHFNYLLAFILVAICLLLYIALMFIEKSKKLVIPEWFKVLFYISFYVFTNIYYFFGLYSTLAGLIVFYIILAFILNIIALSIFFNIQKSETNVLKTTTTYTTFTTFCFAIAFGGIIETLISAYKIIFAKTSIYSSLTILVADMCIIILVSALMAIAFALSLSKSKKLINKCLIKYYSENK